MGDGLEEVKKEAAITKENINSTEVVESNVNSEIPNEDESIEAQDTISNDNVEEVTENSSEIDEASADYDVVLKVKPEKIPLIKSQIIDGKKFIMIPIDEDEQTKVNGVDNLI